MTNETAARRALLVGALLLGTVVSAGEPGAGSPGDAEAGRKLFARCAACHTVKPGAPSTIGPNLHGVLGRPIASVAGFAYSPAMRELKGAWTAEVLDRFVADPKGVAPGTRMVSPGVTDPRERADLLAYVATLREGTPAVAAEPARGFGSNWPAGPGQVVTGELCGACHSLAIVKQQSLSRDTWSELLDWMVKEQGMAEPTPEQRALVLDYLGTHFGPRR